MKFGVFWDVLSCNQVYLTTRQYIPEDSRLHTRRRENLKSHGTNTFIINHLTAFCQTDSCCLCRCSEQRRSSSGVKKGSTGLCKLDNIHLSFSHYRGRKNKWNVYFSLSSLNISTIWRQVSALVVSTPRKSASGTTGQETGKKKNTCSYPESNQGRPTHSLSLYWFQQLKAHHCMT